MVKCDVRRFVPESVSHFTLDAVRITTVNSLYTRGLNIRKVAIHKGKAISVQAYYKPSWFQKVETPKFRDNRTRGLPACDAVPQPTAPPRAPEAIPVEA